MFKKTILITVILLSINSVFGEMDCGDPNHDCDGLEGLWHMNEASWDGSPDEVIDSSSNARHGTAVNEANTVADGWFNRAGSFDGLNDYVELVDFNISEDFAISIWVNADSTSDGQSFIAKNTYDGLNILYLGYWDNAYCVGFRISFDPHANDVYCGGDKVTGWQHLAYVAKKLDSSTTNVKLYRNGTVLLQQNFSYVFGDISGKPWVIGQEWDIDTPTDFFGGKIDEVSIWNRDLSEGEVLELYNNGYIYEESGGEPMIPELDFTGVVLIVLIVIISFFVIKRGRFK